VIYLLNPLFFSCSVQTLFQNSSEEQNELPAFEAKISEEESTKLAQQFERTKKMVPTRYVFHKTQKKSFSLILYSQLILDPLFTYQYPDWRISVSSFLFFFLFSFFAHVGHKGRIRWLLRSRHSRRLLDCLLRLWTKSRMRSRASRITLVRSAPTSNFTWCLYMALALIETYLVMAVAFLNEAPRL